MNKNKKQKSPLALVPILFGLAIGLNVMESGNTSGESTVVFVLLMVIITFIFVFLTVAKKANGSGNAEAVRQRMKQLGFVTREQPEHSHDRLSVSNTAQVCDEDSYTHWKKQLDDFLEAGIIDKSEYSALLNRYKTAGK